MRASMNISLPQPLREWVEEQVAAGNYGTVSEFFRQLLRAEQQRQIRQQIDHNLHQAVDSGESTPMTPADWDRIRLEGRKRIAPKRKAP
jgi:antitoxin ParD1/3/4